MIIEQLNPGACKTYLVASETSRDAVLIDPVLEHVERYEAELSRLNLKLQYVLDTHSHADHVSGAALLRARTGAKYVMHQGSVSPCVDVRVRDGDTLTVGDLTLGFSHTPGHTADSLTVRAGDALFTGDFLFIGEGGAGRTDLPGGDAGEHYDALLKLARLPDRLAVYPGHDYHGRVASTLGAERAQNPRLRPTTREAYLKELEALRLGPAEWMKGVLSANYACATSAEGLELPKPKPSCEVFGTQGDRAAALVRRMTVGDVAQVRATAHPPLIIDVREPDEFNDRLGHIPGARLMPLSTLAADAASLRGQPVITVCRSGTRSASAAALLGTAGVDDVGTMDGGMLAWNDAGLPIERERAA